MSNVKTLSDRIILDHGTGGLLSRTLIEEVVIPALGDRYLGRMEDSSILELASNKIALTTDSFVVDPVFFHCGDIGKISVCGTVNDLAVSGATPLYLTLSLIIETGFPISDLYQILSSAAKAAEEAHVYIVAGDTKVVGEGAADKIFINTSGIGVFGKKSHVLSSNKIALNDDIIITGCIGNHSIHLLSLREGLGFESKVLSDCAPLNQMISNIVDNFGDRIHCIRDITRGGLATVLNEISSDISAGISIDISKVPIQHETKMAAELLGLDPLYLANEGCCCIFCAPDVTTQVLSVLREHPYGRMAARIGKVDSTFSSSVTGIYENGVRKPIECLVGLPLPRLC